MTPLPDAPAALVQLAEAALAPTGCLDLTAEVRQRAAVSAVRSEGTPSARPCPVAP